MAPDREAGSVGVSWRVGPEVLGPGPAEIVRYRPSIVIAGHPIDWSPRSEPRLTFPWSIVSASVDSTLTLRVVVELADGRESGPHDAPWTLPPFHDVAPATDWVLGPPEVIADHAARQAAGLRTWVDGCIGFAEVDGRVVGFGANGGEAEHPPGVASWTMSPDGALADVRSRRTPIDGARADYAAGGPVWVDPATGGLVMVHHGEVHPDGDPGLFWSFVGLASSLDGGGSWTDLGRIIEPALGEREPRVIFTEVCGAPFVVHTDQGVDHMYVYFRETLGDGTMLNLSVARAPLSTVAAAVGTGTAPAFHKWHDGAWAEPGLGGRSTELLPDAPTPRWFDVVVLADHGEMVMVMSDGFTDTWCYLLTTSTDGLSWSPPRRLGSPDVGGEQLYLTLAAPDLSSPRVVRGDRIDLYRMRTATSGAERWDVDARLERLALTRRT